MKLKVINIFLLLLVMISCKVDETVNLISPIEGETVDYCCFDFEWETQKSKSGYQLMLFEEKNFSTVTILDTIVDQTTFKNPLSLTLDKSYTWKIKSLSSDEEAQAEFTTRDYLKDYEGSYDAVVTISDDWDPMNQDSTFMGKLTIKKLSSNSLEYSEEKTGISLVCSFNSFFVGPENRVRFTNNFPNSNSGSCSIDTSDDSIFAYRCFCGSGGGVRYSFEVQK